jgi:hypothetical protein
MSSLNYNGVNLGMVRTVEVDQKPQKEDSGTDTLWFVYTVQAETIFTVLQNGQPIPGLDVAEQFANPAAMMAELRHMLLVPRRPFEYVAGDGTLISVPGGLDAANGPNPISCKITQVTSSTFRVTFTIEVALADCDDVTQAFASNRWSQSQDIDEKGYSTITTDGVVWTRSNMLINPDQLRGICSPPLGKSFRRHSNYKLSKDGLSLQYSFTDKEKYLLPPDGTVDAKMKWSVSTDNMGGKFKGICEVSLEGSKERKKKDLVEMAVLMALNKINRAAPFLDDRNGQVMLMAAGFEDEVFENSVLVRLEANLQTTPFVNGDLGAAFNIGEGVAAGIGAIALGPLSFLLGSPQTKESIEQQRKKALDLAKKTDQLAGARNVVQTPPMLRGADELPTFTSKDAPGIDPELLAHPDFLGMVAAAFMDPCVTLPIKRNLIQPERGGPIGTVTINPPDTFPVGTVEPPFAGDDEGTSTLRTSPRDSTLRSFAIVDSLDPFNTPIGQAGYDPFPGVYEIWLCDIRQQLDTSSGVAEATVDGVPSVSFKLKTDRLQLRVLWTAIKAGFPPEVPVVVDDNLVVSKNVIEGTQVFVAADGVSLIHKWNGVIEATALDPKKVALRGAVPPWMKGRMKTMPSPVPMVLDLNTNPTSGNEAKLKTPNVPVDEPFVNPYSWNPSTVNA